MGTALQPDGPITDPTVLLQWVNGGLGVDEFGRDHLQALFLAALSSSAQGVWMALLLCAVATALVLMVEVGGNRVLGGLLLILIDALDSVPIYVWVLAGVSWAPQYAAGIASIIFVVAGLPLVFNALQGAVRQIIHELYYQAAIALGSGGWRLVRDHLLPNLVPSCVPLFLYVVGAAMAIYGGIGVFGFINRRALDLGVFLLRGREQAGFDVTVLALTLLAYGLIFLLLDRLGRRRGTDLGAQIGVRVGPTSRQR